MTAMAHILIQSDSGTPHKLTFALTRDKGDKHVHLASVSHFECVRWTGLAAPSGRPSGCSALARARASMLKKLKGVLFCFRLQRDLSALSAPAA